MEEWLIPQMQSVTGATEYSDMIVGGAQALGILLTDGIVIERKITAGHAVANASNATRISASEKAKGGSAAAIEAAVNNISEQKKHHILQDKHNWNRLVPDPNDPNNWQKVAAFISLTLSEGKEEPYGFAFQKVLIWGEEMIVVTYQYVDSILRISDTWVVN